LSAKGGLTPDALTPPFRFESVTPEEASMGMYPGESGEQHLPLPPDPDERFERLGAESPVDPKDPTDLRNYETDPTYSEQADEHLRWLENGGYREPELRGASYRDEMFASQQQPFGYELEDDVLEDVLSKDALTQILRKR